MEWLQNLLSKLTELLFWQTLLNRFQWVDWATLAFLILGIIYGARKGFLREIAEILELIVLMLATFFCYPSVVSFLAAYIPKLSERSLAPAGFILTAMLVWFVISILDKSMQTWVHAKLNGAIKNIGGAVLGTVHFIVVWSFLSQAVLLMPVRNLHKFYEAGHSNTGPFIQQLAPEIYQRIINVGQAGK